MQSIDIKCFNIYNILIVYFRLNDEQFSDNELFIKK